MVCKKHAPKGQQLTAQGSALGKWVRGITLKGHKLSTQFYLLSFHGRNTLCPYSVHRDWGWLSWRWAYAIRPYGVPRHLPRRAPQL